MSPDRLKQLDSVYMNIVGEIATMSYATRSKVGAMIVQNGNIISFGWNGLPHGFPNEEIEFIGPDGLLVTNPATLHAESNALMKLNRNGSGLSTRGATLYVTLSPCFECAKLLIQAEIKRVVFRTKYRLTDSLDLLKRADIEIVQLPPV